MHAKMAAAMIALNHSSRKVSNKHRVAHSTRPVGRTHCCRRMVTTSCRRSDTDNTAHPHRRRHHSLTLRPLMAATRGSMQLLVPQARCTNPATHIHITHRVWRYDLLTGGFLTDGS